MQENSKFGQPLESQELFKHTHTYIYLLTGGLIIFNYYNGHQCNLVAKNFLPFFLKKKAIDNKQNFFMWRQIVLGIDLII